MIAILHFGYCESFLADLSVLYVNKQTVHFLASVCTVRGQAKRSLYSVSVLYVNKQTIRFLACEYVWPKVHFSQIFYQMPRRSHKVGMQMQEENNTETKNWLLKYFSPYSNPASWLSEGIHKSRYATFCSSFKKVITFILGWNGCAVAWNLSNLWKTLWLENLQPLSPLQSILW